MSKAVPPQEHPISKDAIVLTNTSAPADELQLQDIWQMLIAGRWHIVLCSLLAAAVALAFVFIVQPEWQANSLIQIGQVGQVEVGSTATTSVEPPPRAVERLKMGAFQNAVLVSLGISPDENDPKAQLYRRTLRAKHIADTDLIAISVRGQTPEEARKFADATISRLQAIHNRIATPSIERLRSQLQVATRELKEVQVQREKVLQDAAQFRRETGVGSRFAENVLASNILAIRDAEVREMQQRKLLLEERLTPLRTYPTSSIEDIHVPDKQVWPRKGLTVLLATAGGFGIGLLLALVLPFLASPTPAARAATSQSDNS